MNDKTDKIDANKVVDVKMLIMAGLIALSGYFWSESLKSRQKFEEMIILNDTRLNDHAMWMRVTDIRLSLIEQQLGILPLDKGTIK